MNAELLKNLHRVEAMLGEQSEQDKIPAVLSDVIVAYREVVNSMLEYVGAPPSFETAEQIVKARIEAEMLKLMDRADRNIPSIRLGATAFTGDKSVKAVWEARADIQAQTKECETLAEAINSITIKSHEQLRQEKIAKLESELAELKNGNA